MFVTVVGCRLKLLQLLQHFEHLASPLAQAVNTFALEFGATTMVSEMMRYMLVLMKTKYSAMCDVDSTTSYKTLMLATRNPAVYKKIYYIVKKKLCHIAKI